MLNASLSNSLEIPSVRISTPRCAVFFAAALLCEKKKKIIESSFSLTFLDCETADIIAAGSDSSPCGCTLFTAKQFLSLFLEGAESETMHGQNGATLAFTSDRRETLPPIGRHVWADGLSESGPDLAAAAIESICEKGKKEEHHHFLDGSTAIKDKNESPFFYFSDKQDEMNFIASIYRGSTVIGVTINTCAD